MKQNASIEKLRARYLALVPRERVMVIAASLVVIAGLGQVLLIGPQLARKSEMTKRIESQEIEITGLRAALAVTPPDPNTGLRAQGKDLDKQIAETDEEYARIQASLVQPEEMGSLVQALIGRYHGLQLAGMRNLPVMRMTEDKRDPQKPVITTADAAAVVRAANAPASAASAPPADAAKADEFGLYRHAMEIRVRGNFADMTAYLRAVESMPRHIHWGSLQIDARTYPDNVMTVTIYTVSLEKSWWVL